MTNFIHLRLHSEYSLKDGLVRLDPLMTALQAHDMPAVALTEHCNLFSAVKFYKAAKTAKIKPIFGADILIRNPENARQPYQATLLCRNQLGYQHLTSLLSRAYLEGQQEGQALIEINWLAEQAEGLILLSGGREGDVGQMLLAEHVDLARNKATFWQQKFGDAYYLELQRTDHPDDDRYIQQAIALATELTIPVVATNNVRFIQADEFEAHEARVCIHQGNVLSDPKRIRYYRDSQYLKSAAEMTALFADIPEAIANTVEIMKRCNVQLSLGQVHMPHFPRPESLSEEEYFKQRAQQGLGERLNKQRDEAFDQTAYQQRLDEEIQIILNMGYAGYFLIVADFIQWAKDKGIAVGPGRGSGAGSLVAYALKITDLDPLSYELLFERFLNPERISMPDFDVDFCMEGRDRVIEYVADRYGHDSVSQIITYGTMAAKAVVRDVGRVLGFPYGFVDQIAKMIPFELGITLNKAIAQEEALKQRYQQEDDVRTLIDLALQLEGITRNVGKHAGGVVIAPSKLTDFTPLYCEPGGSNLVTQFDMSDVEAVGLVKFDFLGLRTLTIIDWSVQMINARHQKMNEDLLDISLLPMADTATFNLLKACHTTAVFQLESRGMKDLIKRLQPDNFEEIIALVALFRPGPLQSGMVDDFIDRKHGRAAVHYPHEDIAHILKPTYGVILYQEQVMQIAQVLAGYTLGGADMLRRAMGKKKPEEMAKHRTIFTEGAAKHGVSRDKANSIFDLMEKFAGYGFNKSHSAAYALIAYQTAWLKAHYPAEFMAAVLSSDMDNTDKVVNFVEECKQRQLSLLPPDINHSHYRFTTNSDQKIVYGLGAIKGVGEAAIESIVKERQQHGNYQDLQDFCYRCDLRKVNRRVLEALIRSGCFDHCATQNRATLLASLDTLLQAATQQDKAQSLGQGDLFSAGSLEYADNKTAYYTKADEDQNLRLRGEKDSLGFYLSGHPMDAYQAELSQFIKHHVSQLMANQEQSIRLAGYIVAIRTMRTKRGDRMAFVSLDDCTGRIEVAFFSDVYQSYREALKKDQLVIIEGTISVDTYTDGFRMSADTCYCLDEFRAKFCKALQLKLNSSQVNGEFLEALKGSIRDFQGQCPVIIVYKNNNSSAAIKLNHNNSILPSDNLLLKIRQLDESLELKFLY